MNLEDMEFGELIKLALAALAEVEDQFTMTEETKYRIKISKEILSEIQVDE